MAPVQLRVGGAFLGIALVLVLYAVLAMLRGDATFPITPQALTVLVAVGIVGAFATYNTKQEGSRTQVGTLIAAVVLIELGFIAPDAELMVTTPFWLLGWALAAGLCAVVLRRTPKKGGSRRKSQGRNPLVNHLQNRNDGVLA